jgi:uncharacterized protein (DUF302 family)
MSFNGERSGQMKKALFAALLCLVIISSAGIAAAQEYGVYVKAIEKAEGSFDEVTTAVTEAVSSEGWTVLTSFEEGVPEGCGYRAWVIVFDDPGYTEKLMGLGPRSAFALPLRIGVYQDEQGTHVAFVNPASINRTVLGDDVEKDLALEMMEKLSGVITGAVKGQAVDRQIGQIRDKGRVGGMGGGDFDKKLKPIYSEKEAEGVFEKVAVKVKEGILANDKGWELAYTQEFKEPEAVLFGVRKTALDTKAFDIAGQKRRSEDNACPGLDHAAAFPVGVVVLKEEGWVRALTLDEMYRMKLYFEDAGKWAFMKNMAMPGRIESEIVGMSASKLKK